jgi:hypothetical protein
VLGPHTPPAVVPCRHAAVLNLPELVLRPNNQCSTECVHLLQHPQAGAVGVPGGSPPWASTAGFPRSRPKADERGHPPRTQLLRKEVIQPHLPVRLPCYDFVPIASPTFDGSLPYGLGHRLRVLPTFVT